MTPHTISINPITINAPAQKVWDILIDFEQYPKWNPFTVKAESTLKIGETVDLYIPQKNGSLKKYKFILEEFDAPHSIAWSMPKLGHRLILNAYRVQTVEAVNEMQCTYTTADTFNGWLAANVYKTQNKWVTKNFNNLAQALKARAEEH